MEVQSTDSVYAGVARYAQQPAAVSAAPAQQVAATTDGSTAAGTTSVSAPASSGDVTAVRNALINAVGSIRLLPTAQLLPNSGS